MKRVTAIILALIVLLSLAACGGQKAAEEPKPAQTQTETQKTEPVAVNTPAEEKKAEELAVPTANLRLGCTSATGTYTIVGTAMSQVMNEFCPTLQITPEVTDGSVANMQMLASGDLDLGMTSAFVCKEASTGGSKNFPDPVEMYALCSYNASAVHFVARTGSGINSVSDLVGKRVSTCEPGSSHEKYGMLFLNAYGIDPEKDLDKWVRVSIADSCDAISDNRLDAVFYMGGAPVTKILELVEKGDAYVVELDDKAVSAFQEVYPFAYNATIPAGVYGDKDLSALVGTNLLVCSKEMSDEEAYWIVKTLFDNFDGWKSCHASVANYFVEMKNAILGSPIEFHPGAIKYFKEIGVM